MYLQCVYEVLFESNKQYFVKFKLLGYVWLKVKVRNGTIVHPENHEVMFGYVQKIQNVNWALFGLVVMTFGQ